MQLLPRLNPVKVSPVCRGHQNTGKKLKSLQLGWLQPAFHYIWTRQGSARNGERHDEIMGATLTCMAAERFRDQWDSLSVTVWILAFADETGMRCPTALIRLRALAGTLTPSVFDLTDQSGFTMQKAMEDFGLSPDAAVNLRRHAAGILGYAEVHIEQDPVSETASQSFGIAAGICGISRFLVDVTGETGHAGTVPIAGCKNAMVALSRMIAAITDKAERETPASRRGRATRRHGPRWRCWMAKPKP